MIGHLGSRVSALLDGQLSPDDTERAWEHVHTCHGCRDLVEREGWIKTRLAGLSWETAGAPRSLKGALLGASAGEALLVLAQREESRSRRNVGLAALGGSAVGAAMMGVLALGAAPADAPTSVPRGPAAQLSQGPVPVVANSRRP